MRTQIVILSVALVFISGCSLAPDYTQPPAPIPAQWPQGTADKNTQNTPEAQAIWELSQQEFFTDPKLHQIIGIALNNNRDLRLAALNVKRAQAIYGIQRTELLPSLDADISRSKQRTPPNVMGFPEALTIDRYDINLGINSWELDFFGRIRSLTDQALEDYLATEEARKSAQIALVSEVASAYFNLAADREKLQLAQSTLKTQQAAYDLFQRQYQVGIVNQLNLRQAQIQVDTARGEVILFKQIVAQDQNALNFLAGSPVSNDLLPTDLTSVNLPKETFAGLSSEILLNRPDILSAEHQLKRAYAYIGVARATFFPRISLTSSIGTASNELSGLFDSGTKKWSYGPQINIPIFDTRVWAAYRVSKINREVALTQYEKTIQSAFREVADTLAIKDAIDQRLSSQQSLIDAVADTYALSNKRYEKGIDSYLGVLDAQRSLYAAQKGFVSLRLIKFANRVRLYAILGGGSS